MCSSLDGSHNRAITRTAAIVAQDISSRSGGRSPSRSRSKPTACHNRHASQTSPNRRPRSNRKRFRSTSIGSSGTSSSKRLGCRSIPINCRATALAAKRPLASSSPSRAIVSCRTFLPQRNDLRRKASRQSFKILAFRADCGSWANTASILAHHEKAQRHSVRGQGSGLCFEPFSFPQAAEPGLLNPEPSRRPLPCAVQPVGCVLTRTRIASYVFRKSTRLARTQIASYEPQK